MKTLRIPVLGMLLLGLVLTVSAPSSAEADRKRAKYTVGGAVIGTGVGYLVGGSKGARAGAVVGAIAGATK